jgi:Fe-S-cluster containining protein
MSLIFPVRVPIAGTNCYHARIGTSIMNCRKGCAACCIAVSITSPLPGMPEGKPAGVRCVNLTEANACRIHGTADYPEFCRGLRPSQEMCGEKNEEAFAYLARLEALTRPRACE